MTTRSSFKFYCSKCGQRLEAQDEWRGRKVQCPSCNAVIAIPEEEENQSEFEATPSSTPQNPPEPSFDKTFLWISGSFILLFIVLTSALVIAISLSSEGNNTTTTNITNTTTRQQYTPQPETQKESEEERKRKLRLGELSEEEWKRLSEEEKKQKLIEDGIDPHIIMTIFKTLDVDLCVPERDALRLMSRYFTSEEEFMNCPNPIEYNANTCAEFLAKKFKKKYAKDPVLTQYDPLVKKTYVAPAGARFFLAPNYNSRIEFRDFPDGNLRLYPENCLPKYVIPELERIEKIRVPLKKKYLALKSQSFNEEEIEKARIQQYFYALLHIEIRKVLSYDTIKKGVYTRRDSGSWVLTEELKPGRYFVAFDPEFYNPEEDVYHKFWYFKDIEKTDKVLIVNFSDLEKKNLAMQEVE